MTPASCSCSTRASARSRSSSTSPNWMDWVGQACAHAGVCPSLEAVVAERALLGDAHVLGPVGALAAVDHAVGAGRDAVAAAVADVVLHDDGAELRAEQRPGRADVEAGGVRAVLADVRGHQPAEVRASTASSYPAPASRPRRPPVARACPSTACRGR